MAATADETDSVTTSKTENTRFGNAVTGELGEDFLRIESGQSVPNNMVNPSPVFAYNTMYGGFQQSGGTLTVTVVQATLAKNYGMTRMDPYCRLKIGINVFETTTAYNGAKTPRWNKIIQAQVPETLREFYVEVFDECSFSVDERIAWGNIILKDELFQGETVEDWFSLSGKQGEEKEGMIHLVLQYQKMNMVQNPMMVVNPMGGPVVVPPIYGYNPYAQPVSILQPQGYPGAVVHPQRQQVQPNVNNQQITTQVSEADTQTLKEMCPGIAVDIIQSVLQQSGGNIDRAAGILLEMSTE